MVPCPTIGPVTSTAAAEAELQGQRATVEAELREGWVPEDAGRPRTLNASAYVQARKIVNHGGWTGLDRATIQAVCDGARAGDPLPPLDREPFIDHVSDDVEVIITESRPKRFVAVLFSDERFPGIRFGHRMRTPSAIFLKEEVETGALHRMMANQPSPDASGIAWTTWDDGVGAPRLTRNDGNSIDLTVRVAKQPSHYQLGKLHGTAAGAA